MSTTAAKVRNPLSWVPSSYLAEGIPLRSRDLGCRHDVSGPGPSDGEITLATASIGIAWSLKPFWAAFLDMFKEESSSSS